MHLQRVSGSHATLSPRALLGALLALAVLAGHASARPPAADLAPPPAADGARIAAAFAKLSRATTWQLVTKVPLKFDAHHPEGVARVGEHYVLSAVEVTEPTQRYEPRARSSTAPTARPARPSGT